MRLHSTFMDQPRSDSLLRDFAAPLTVTITGAVLLGLAWLAWGHHADTTRAHVPYQGATITTSLDLPAITTCISKPGKPTTKIAAGQSAACATTTGATLTVQNLGRTTFTPGGMIARGARLARPITKEFPGGHATNESINGAIACAWPDGTVAATWSGTLPARTIIGCRGPDLPNVVTIPES